MNSNWIDLVDLIRDIWMTVLTLMVAGIWLLQRRALDHRAPSVGNVGNRRLNWLMLIFLVWGVGGFIAIVGLGFLAGH